MFVALGNKSVLPEVTRLVLLTKPSFTQRTFISNMTSMAVFVTTSVFSNGFIQLLDSSRVDYYRIIVKGPMALLRS